MPYYDQYSGMEVETPEEEAERRKREEEARKKAGTTPVATREVVTYEDGSQTHTTTQEVPGPVAPEQPGMGTRFGQAVSQAGTNFVNNLNRGIDNLKAAPDNFARNVAAVPGQIQRAIAPVDQSAYTAQQESGGRANIGYHYPANAQGQRQSTAYGPFGITAGAYQDIQRANPAFAGRDITTLTPEEQKAAYQTYTGLNAQRLQGLGVEPTPANQRLAHLLGPSGAARFLQTGEVSAQAAAANGGVERLKAIAQGRIAGGQAPASGATQQPPAQPAPAPVSPYSLATGQTGLGLQAPAPAPAPAPAVDTTAQAIGRYQAIQNSPDDLMKFAFDANTPDYLKQRAKEQLVQSYDSQKKEAEAAKMLPTLSQNDLAKIVTKKSEGNSVGDWLQYLLFKHVGLNDLANQKGEQLGIGHQWQQAYIQDESGRDVPVEVQTSASGRVLRGNLAGSDTALTPEQLQQAAGQVMNAGALKTAQTQATHAYTTAYTSLMKQRDALVQRGAGEQEMAARGLDMASIQTRANEAGQNVLNAARKNYRGAAAGTAPGAQPAATAGTTNVTPTKPVRVLDNWTGFRPGETTANYDKRQQYTPEDIETEARQLVAGDKTIKDITGRDAGLLRHYASARAKELDPTWSATDADARRDALKKWTNPDSNVAKQVRSHITASNSIQDVKQAFEALQNGNTPLFNEIRNSFRQNTGNDLPINAKTGAMLLGPEIIKSIIPGGGGVTERLEAQHLMGVNLSPDQQTAVFKILEDFQGNSLKALETDWTRAKLPKDQFRERVLGGSPAAQELYDAATAHQAQQAARRAGLAVVPTPAEVQAEIKRRQGSK